MVFFFYRISLTPPSQPCKAQPENIIEAFAEQKHPWRVELLPRMNPHSAQPPDYRAQLLKKLIGPKSEMAVTYTEQNISSDCAKQFRGKLYREHILFEENLPRAGAYREKSAASVKFSELCAGIISPETVA